MPGDLIFVTKGTPGRVCMVPDPADFCIAQDMVAIRADEKKIYPKFLFALLRTDVVQEQIEQMHVGTLIPHYKKGDFDKLLLLIPERNVQEFVGDMYFDFSAKIELNRRMNETLEAMARALFKSWFVDFDPVRARMGGAKNLSPLQKYITDLFPDSFEESELGEIPKGWRATRWGELVTLEYGKGLSGYNGEVGAYPVYGTNGRIGRHSEPLCKHAGIIIGRKGAYRGVHFCDEPFFVIDTAFYVEPKRPVELRWAYYELLRQDINSMDSGSAIPSTSREDFYSLPVLAPQLEVQQAFAQFLNPVWARQKQNEEESRTLATLRDTLLPKLISGELRVKDAERFIGGHVR
jgi:type I restriction enzyme S subunit